MRSDRIVILRCWFSVYPINECNPEVCNRTTPRIHGDNMGDSIVSHNELCVSNGFDGVPSVRYTDVVDAESGVFGRKDLLRYVYFRVGVTSGSDDLKGLSTQISDG